MQKLIRIGLVALVLSVVVPSPVHAISIGLLGGDVDPILPLITDITFVDLLADDEGDPNDPCGFLAGAFYCAAYEVPNNGDYPTTIDSIDFRMQKPNGDFYTTAEIGLFVVHGSSNLPNLGVSSLFNDGFTFTLYDPLFLSLDCGPVGNYCRGDFFSDDAAVAGVSVLAVNRVPNPGAAAIPEPASLVLFGTGAAACFVRRRRVR